MNFDLNVILRFFNYFMALIYIAAGALIIITDPDILSINKITKTGLGIVISAYGFYRIYRAIHSNTIQDEK